MARSNTPEHLNYPCLYEGGLPLAEMNGAGQVVRSYTWGAMGLVSDHSAAGSRFYLFDALGNTRHLLSASGQTISTGSYRAYGGMFVSLPDTPFGWRGRYGQWREAETGLLLLGARWYSANLGRFLSRDPSLFLAGANVYAYCAGDPVNLYDPTGLEPFSIGGALDGLMGGAFSDWGNAEGMNDGGKISAGDLWGSRLKAGVALGSTALITFQVGKVAIAGLKPMSSLLTRGNGSSPVRVNLAGEGEIPGAINVNGRWITDASWRSSRDGKPLGELIAGGDRFVIADNARLPFANGSVDIVYTNNVQINGASWLGAYPQTSEIWRILQSSGSWIHNGVKQVRP